MLLQINDGTMSFGGDVLFDHIHLEIREGQKTALIGRNGCGKTTLLKIISGVLPLEGGTVVKSPNTTVGYLTQTAFADESLTVRQEFDRIWAPLLKTKAEMDELSAAMAKQYDQAQLARYAALQQRFEALGGYQYNQEQITLFTRFGFALDDLDRPLANFSGGQKTRIAFVKLLLQKPDLLLLDEPTNHLDMATISWLEGYLQKYPRAILVVSHDRMFLDHVVSQVYEMEFGKLYHYSGNYTASRQQKKADFARQQAAYQRQQAEIERLSALIEKFRYKKNKASFAQSKIKYLQRMDRVEKPREDKKNIRLSFDPRFRGGASVLTVDQLAIGYQSPPLATVSFTVRSGQKLAVIGPNGSGKSTLLKTLMGQVAPLSGEYLYGHQIQPGYFDQTLAEFTTERTVLEEIWDSHPEYDQTAIRKILGQFLFTADDVYKSCRVLSGGEKVRLALAELMLSQANLLILDEPTNYLDIPGKEALESALEEYSGTVIFVSHDRYLIRRLATAILVIDGAQSGYWPLNYDEYCQRQDAAPPTAAEAKPEPAAERPSDAKQQRANAKKAASLEARIAKAEDELEALRQLRYDPEYYHDYRRMAELEDQIDEKHNEIEHLMADWEKVAS